MASGDSGSAPRPSRARWARALLICGRWREQAGFDGQLSWATSRGRRQLLASWPCGLGGVVLGDDDFGKAVERGVAIWEEVTFLDDGGCEMPVAVSVCSPAIAFGIRIVGGVERAKVDVPMASTRKDLPRRHPS